MMDTMRWIHLGVISFILGSVTVTGNHYVRPAVDIPPVHNHESRLIRDLLDRYSQRNKETRPVVNASDPVNVQFGIRLVHLDLDEKEQMMKTSCWLRMRWYDTILKWNPADYGWITHVTLSAKHIWTPDISLVNTGETEVKEMEADVSIKYIGRVFWAPQRMYSSACLIDVTEYPYDRHTCDMWFQSISNYDWSLNISSYYKSPIDLDTYLTSYKHAQEWDIISNTSVRVDKPRDVGMILMFSRRAALQFSLTVQRRPGFKAMLLIVPCALLSFLFPLIFCFPPERPDRHTLAMSLFASLTIMMFMVNETAPPSATFVPRLTLYYCVNLLVLLVATCCSAIVVNLSRRGETRDRVPVWVRQVFIKFFGKVLCFGNRLNHLREVKRASRRSRVPQETLEDREHKYIVPPNNMYPEDYPMEGIQETSPSEFNMLTTINRRLTSIETRLIRQSSKKVDIPDVTIPTDIRMEWRTLSLILDRLFFYVFLALDFISFAVFHPRYVD